MKRKTRAWGYTAFIWVVSAGLSGNALVSMTPEWNWSWVPAVFIVVPIALALRALRHGVEVNETELVIKNLVRTWRLKKEEITDIRVRNYDGFWTRFTETGFLVTVSISSKNHTYTAYGLVGRRRVMREKVDRLRKQVGLPETPQRERGRHAAR